MQEPLDPFTADRLLSGAVRAEDAPPGYRDVVRLLEAVGAAPTQAELTGGPATVAAMAASLAADGVPSGGHGRRSGRSRFRGLKVLAATLVLLLTLGTGLAFAGSLPAGFQKVASGILANLGISVPNGQAGLNENSPATEAPPDAALFGLCTAWQSGKGGDHGRKNDAVAFQRLAVAAGGSEKLGDFCAGVIADHAHANNGQINRQKGQQNAEEKSGGKSGGNGHKP
jgi:hypothetical protein